MKFLIFSLILDIASYCIVVFVANNRYRELKRILKINGILFYIILNIISIGIVLSSEIFIKKCNIYINTYIDKAVILILEMLSFAITSFSIVIILAYFSERYANDEMGVESSTNAFYSLILILPIHCIEAVFYYMMMKNEHFGSDVFLDLLKEVSRNINNIDTAEFVGGLTIMFCIELEVMDYFAYKNRYKIHSKIAMQPLTWYILLNLAALMVCVMSVVLVEFVVKKVLVCVLGGIFSMTLSVISVLKPYSYTVVKYQCRPSQMHNYINVHISIIAIPAYVIECLCYFRLLSCI